MYYGPHFDWTLEYYTDQGAITKSVTVDDFYFVLTMVKHYMERYEPRAYELSYGKQSPF